MPDSDNFVCKVGFTIVFILMVNLEIVVKQMSNVGNNAYKYTERFL